MAVEDNYKVGHVIMITLSAAIGGFLFGFDSSVINGANVALKGYFNCNDMQLGLAVSLALIGAAIGAYFAGRLADKFGRVRCMLAAAVLFFISAIGSGLPFTIYSFSLSVQSVLASRSPSTISLPGVSSVVSVSVWHPSSPRFTLPKLHRRICVGV